MILITGGAGFIGSNIVRHLNHAGETDIIVVDNLGRTNKFTNLIGCSISDYLDKREFENLIDNNSFGKIDLVFHQGARTDTMENDSRYLVENNYTYSKKVLKFCNRISSPLIYASSAAVYGQSKVFVSDPKFEIPLNAYGFSKLMFDNFVRRNLQELDIPVVGLRYFNVYGPGEHHKGKMASVLYQFFLQLISTNKIRLFSGSHGYANGEQRRDFIYVKDIVDVNMFFLNNPTPGIYNVGSGVSVTFNNLAQLLIGLHGTGKIEYTEFPEELLNKYQSNTKSDNSSLREIGYLNTFTRLQDGLQDYFNYLNNLYT